MSDNNVITIYEEASIESKLYDALFSITMLEEFESMTLWQTIGVLEMLKMNLGSGYCGE